MQTLLRKFLDILSLVGVLRTTFKKTKPTDTQNGCKQNRANMVRSVRNL